MKLEVLWNQVLMQARKKTQTLSGATGGFQDKGEMKILLPISQLLLPVKTINDPGSESDNGTTPPDQAEYFDKSVFTNVTDIDETSSQGVKIGEYYCSAKEWKTGQ
eukprot:11919030-Ditylum_brightwellii.AAC.1